MFVLCHKPFGMEHRKVSELTLQHVAHSASGCGHGPRASGPGSCSKTRLALWSWIWAVSTCSSLAPSPVLPLGASLWARFLQCLHHPVVLSAADVPSGPERCDGRPLAPSASDHAEHVVQAADRMRQRCVWLQCCCPAWQPHVSPQWLWAQPKTACDLWTGLRVRFLPILPPRGWGLPSHTPVSGPLAEEPPVHVGKECSWPPWPPAPGSRLCASFQLWSFCSHFMNDRTLQSSNWW